MCIYYIHGKNIKILSISNSIELIGSNDIDVLKYSTDFDLQEHINIKQINDYNKYVQKIQNIFNDIEKKDTVFITDFKAGTFNTQPIRWNYDEIIQGEKYIDHIHVKLFDAIQQHDNKVKIDLIAFINHQFVEFSCNYYFTKNNVSMKSIEQSLLLDINMYYHQKKFMKMLKRILSYRKAHKENASDIITFLNSQAGLLYQLHHQIEVLNFVITENIKVKRSYIKQAVDHIFEIVPAKYKKKLNGSSSDLETLRTNIHNAINELVIEFLN